MRRRLGVAINEKKGVAINEKKGVFIDEQKVWESLYRGRWPGSLSGRYEDRQVCSSPFPSLSLSLSSIHHQFQFQLILLHQILPLGTLYAKKKISIRTKIVRGVKV